EMVGADLDELIGTLVPEPVGEAPVQRCTSVLGQAGVGDVAYQHMLEAVRTLARDGRARLLRDEVAGDELAQRVGNAARIRLERFDGAAPEDAADQRRPLEHRLGSRS